MELFPAIDLRGGQAVRLIQGDFNQETSFGDAADLAERYMDAGAKWIHVVDLDAARTGEATNREILGDIVKIAKDHEAQVQTGGGIRSITDIQSVLDLGAQRAIIGTKAVEDPEFLGTACEKFGSQVCVGLDYRHRSGVRELSVRGWEQGGQVSLEDFLSRIEPLDLGALIITAIDKDGTLQGPDLDGLKSALSNSSHDIIASGGVGSISDIVALKELSITGPKGLCGLSGVIAGRALVNGAIEISSAVIEARR